LFDVGGANLRADSRLRSSALLAATLSPPGVMIVAVRASIIEKLYTPRKSGLSFGLTVGMLLRWTGISEVLFC
jgi:hypothetical protein